MRPPGLTSILMSLQDDFNRILKVCVLRIDEFRPGVVGDDFNRILKALRLSLTTALYGGIKMISIEY